MSKYINADEQERIMLENKMIETNDWVEVVRCKDCKHSWKHSEDVYECGCFCAMTTPNFYCADGERKEK